MADLFVDSAPLTRKLTITLNSFTVQKCIYPFSKTFNEVASTASLGREFHRFPTLWAKKFLLSSDLNLLPLILRPCPLVLVSPTSGENLLASIFILKDINLLLLSPLACSHQLAWNRNSAYFAETWKVRPRFL